MPDFNFKDYDSEAWEANEHTAANIQDIYDTVIKESTAAAATVEIIDGEIFSFNRYPKLKDRVNKIFKKLAKLLENNIAIGNQMSWSISNKKSDDLVDFIYNKTGISKKVLDLYDPRNTNALAAFQNRKDNGLSLSGRVWNATQQAKEEIEMAIDLGLGDGQSAAEMSRSVRQYLLQPDKLFRKVRDKHSQLKLSQKAKAYHPGQGVYRSSYKNAMRLTRTENNMAYREADFIRWNNLTFVTGIQIQLSNNPHHCPLCQELVGKYPKDFKFTGWHPQCRCYATPILITDKEFEKMSQMELNDEDTTGIKSKNNVSKVPEVFSNWLKQNKKRIEVAASIPYFIRDNKTVIGY